MSPVPYCAHQFDIENQSQIYSEAYGANASLNLYAKKLGTNRRTLSDWLLGKREPPDAKIDAVVAMLINQVTCANKVIAKLSKRRTYKPPGTALTTYARARRKGLGTLSRTL